MAKFSKIDINSLVKKSSAPKRKTSVRREVLPLELQIHLRRLSYEKKVAAQSYKPKQIYRPKQSEPLMPAFVKAGSLAAVAVILVLILQTFGYLSSAKQAAGEILGAATTAYGDLNAASDDLSGQDFSSANELFVSAQTNIQKAQDLLNDFKPLQWLTPQGDSANHMLLGAGFLAEAGQKLSNAANLIGEIELDQEEIQISDFNEKLRQNRNQLAESRALIEKAANEFEQVGSIPADYGDTLDTGKKEVAELNNILRTLIQMQDLYLSLIDGEKTYLLIFQNYDEQRATGGFIGTYGVLKTSNGGLSRLKIKSIYDLDGRIFEQVAAPGPFQPEITKWGIRDANWFVDFPTTAKKLLSFFEKGEETANGVIATTPRLFEELLALTGPIVMEEYGEVLTAENFQETVQRKTSVEYDHDLNQPKQFLDDFAPVLIERLSQLDKKEWFAIFQIFYDNFSERNVMMYDTDPDIQGQIQDLGLSGKILDTNFDYLSINNSNLGGTKTDLSIVQQALLNSKIMSDGSVINTLQITRTNQDDEPNRSYTRILVPAASHLISAAGFDHYEYYPSQTPGMKTDPDLAAWDRGEIISNVLVHEESGKQEFSGWIQTEAGQTKIVTLSYALPFKIETNSFSAVHPYSLLVQKQAGSLPYEFIGTLNLGIFRPKWSLSELEETVNVVNFKSNSNTDDFWALLLAK